jgi:DNA-binding XRE family transcriptional regulator
MCLAVGLAISKWRIIILLLGGIYALLDFVTLRTYVPGHKLERIRKLPRKPSFAHYLRDARIKRRLSVAEVAEQVGVSTASIYFWENDHVRPRDANLSALCKVLKLPIRAAREMAAV